MYHVFVTMMPENESISSLFFFSPGATIKFEGIGAKIPAFPVDCVLYFFAVDVLCRNCCNIPLSMSVVFWDGYPSSSQISVLIP